MPGSIYTVEVAGLEELNRAIMGLPPAIRGAARKGLLQGAEPIRKEASELSGTALSGMARTKPNTWQVQRKGQTQSAVYIVPKMRGMGPNKTPWEERRAERFQKYMYGKAYEPALEHNQTRVREYVDVWLEKVATGFNTGGF